MKKLLSLVLFCSVFVTGSAVQAKTAQVWKPSTPEGYTLISWVKAPGVISFMKAPENNGYLDFLTYVYLPSNEIKFITSSTPRLDWGPGREPFMPPTNLAAVTTTEAAEATFEPTIFEIPTTTESNVTSTIATTTSTSTSTPTTTIDSVRDWAFSKMVVEKAKASNPRAQFIWNVPFFNVTMETTDLSLGLKSSDATGNYVTSGSRPPNDMAAARRMLIIDNKTGTASISDFDENIFLNSGDQAVEGFSATETYKGTDTGVARLFLGVRPGGKELVVYCSQGASPRDANNALLLAGVPLENQMQADGGTSATCAYNLPGQYFVEPGRTLPHLMGAFPILLRGVATTEGLNVRSGPGPKFNVTRKLSKGSAVRAYEEKNGWLRISDQGEWVSAKYIRKQ